MDYFNETVERFKQLSEVESIALGGSRATGKNDTGSDYDVYIYLSSPLSCERRREILELTCSKAEVNNQYFETEDDCVMKDGIGLELIYRDMEETEKGLERVLMEHQSSLGYTTCFCHNIHTSKIQYDLNGRYETLKRKCAVPYPEPLRKNIITKNRELLDGRIPSYSLQIESALKRGDIVSVNHRVTAFLASYFDIIFALNGMYHPGEKRLIEICVSDCEILPNDFEKNILGLLKSEDKIAYVKNLVRELDKVNEIHI